MRSTASGVAFGGSSRICSHPTGGEPGGEIPLHAACHLYQQDWGIPVTIVEGGDDALRLDLRGT